MNPRTQWIRVAAVALSVAAIGCADSRCNAANIDAALEGCRREPFGMPDFNVCFRAGLQPPDPKALLSDLRNSAVALCSANGNGEVIECTAKLKDACLQEPNPSKRALIGQACQSGPQLTAEEQAKRDACWVPCFEAETKCKQGCPVDDWDHCYPCTKSCGVWLARCVTGCP